MATHILIKVSFEVCTSFELIVGDGSHFLLGNLSACFPLYHSNTITNGGTYQI